MKYPEELKYTKSHEWVKENPDGTILVGLTDYAQDQLGDVVFVNLPEEGDEVTLDESFADVESVKAVSDVYSPVTGKVSRVNEALLDAPEAINEDPYGSWMVEIGEVSARADLMDAAAYRIFVESKE